MRLDLSDLVSVLLLLATLALALPKRDWRSISARFRETSDGERNHLFGPPSLAGPQATGIGARTLQLLHAEHRRLLELGIPVLIAAWYAEDRGAGVRRDREAAWRESKQGLLFRHLGGEMPEEDLQARLRERDYLLPASGLVLSRPSSFVLPPIRWLVDWEERLKEMEAEARQGCSAAAMAPPAGMANAVGAIAVAATVSQPETEAMATGRTGALIEIHTLGEVRVLIDGRDVAHRLMHAPALAFTVLYLLSWEVRHAGDRVTREFFGEETFNGQDPAMRRTGVSQRLANLKRHFPPLRSRIVADGEYLGFDPDGCDIDVRWLFGVADRVKGAGGVLTTELSADANKALALAAREYLPGWERIESKGTLGGSAAAEVIADVRDRVVAARLDILGGLADGAVAAGHRDEAVSYLEEALRLRPERTALAQRLADLHDQNGQRQRAARLRAEYGLDGAQ